MATTLHTCDYHAPHYFSHCDGGGCQTNAHNVDGNGMCPGGNCKINTTKPFTISHASVSQDGDTLSGVNNWFSQDGKTWDWNACNKGDYIKNMGYSIKGIVFSASLWGGNGTNMDWLDGMTGCSGPANIDGASVTFKNFALKKNKSASGEELLQ